MPPLFDFSPLANKLTDNAKDSLNRADKIARRMGAQYIGTEHLLLGMLQQESSIGAKLLTNSGISIDRAKIALDLTPKTLLKDTIGKGLSETAKLTLQMGLEIAREFQQDVCGTEHILASILAQKNSRAMTLLKDMKVDMNSLHGEIENYLNSQQFDESSKSSDKSTKKKKAKRTALDFFGDDLTAAASENKLDPLIGREDQLTRMITILARRNKNNPVLIGEPGVGKTAIVEGLAQRIAKEEVPDNLLGKRIISLDLAGMVAGTKYRGEFEERLKRVMKEISQSSDIILFIDEIHLLVGTGSAEGSMDAANMLKPALARGDLRVIGATTTDEYREYIEEDGALERRFQSINVPEASVEETVQILTGLKSRYEEFHGVAINDEVVKETVKFSKRYMHERFFPDKAIDLIDESAAHIRVQRGSIPKEQRKLKDNIKQLTERMEKAVDDEDYERAALYKTRLAQLNEKLEKLRAEYNRKHKLALTVDDVAEAVSIMSGVPMTKVVKAEAKYLINLEKHLSKHIIGQQEAITQVSKSIRRNRSGVSDGNRPIGSFIFLGPSGVGKTELARVLAKEFYDSEKSMIKLDMSEFSEKHTVSRLVGAPAGYVGFEDGGQLTDKIRRQPYSLVLFDEIEKAHPEVFNMLLQILEDGVLTDARGRSVSFANTIIIMTSNIGADVLQKEASLGFAVSSKDQKKELRNLHDKTTAKVLDRLKKSMRPELLNRIDKTIVFSALTTAEAHKVLDLQLEELRTRMHEHRLGLKVSSTAKKFLINKGYDADQGVRPLRRIIQDELEDAIAHGLLNNDYEQGDVISVGTNKAGLNYKVTSE
ncbi:ATP-dependent Clp protease ATP-binding subunit [Candidatus Saccharibacteria bacterium]|jgi:ATP-dependent Clp protease ATP-binding subunit ClpC|nr:ATP-dependent Clp protease ATP-binding subunit [Candidatus Saccharibacteria bacterium]MBP9132267.1 ATP-dependent Clp protease ATP-binding subunit [Candidatus Saccharibacteria bacterium]